MNKIDHLVINVDGKLQKDASTIELIRKNGFPYEPKKGKKTKGFRVSNLWIGKEYIEMVSIIEKDGGGWKKDWVELYNQGKRGAVCLMIDVSDIESLYRTLTNKSINVSVPEKIEYKLFGLVKVSPPWRNMYLPYFGNEKFQIGFQQLDSQDVFERFEKRMTPNSIKNQIMGMSKITIKGNWTPLDYNMLEDAFPQTKRDNHHLIIKINNGNEIVFVKDKEFLLEVEMNNHSSKYKSKTKIENVYLF